MAYSCMQLSGVKSTASSSSNPYAPLHGSAVEIIIVTYTMDKAICLLASVVQDI